MKFKSGLRRKPIDYEKDLIRYWKKNKTFEKSIENRPKENSYVFYDGPPFLTGTPHYGQLLSSTIKDAVPRYWTMKGKRVERVWGWDCHGLPAEVFTEKKLGIKDKRDIGTKISLEDYILATRDNMVQTSTLWEDTIDRIGRWVDFKGAYKTMDKDYMESVWWAFKELYNKGKIYEGEKVLLYCTRDATPISKAEVAMDNSYQDTTDPSAYVKFKLKGEDASLLVWTTTPWTLPANTAIAVNKNLKYSQVKVGEDSLIIAKSLLDKVLIDEKHRPIEYKIEKELLGKELVGKQYEPIFEDKGTNAHKIWHGYFVSDDEGTGVVHLAPAFGEDDYELSKKEGFPIINNVDDNGFYGEGEWKGQYVWDVNKDVAKTLFEREIIWKLDYITHQYPHCHRCGTKLIYRAHPSWFMDVGSQRRRMLEENGNINWFPEHIKDGRSAKTIESAPDWNVSRDRFWATAMPVWKGVDKKGAIQTKVIGSYDELKKLSGKELDDYHRPWVDDIEFEIDGVVYKRIEKVLDCWFESGSMPFAQFHYPFENKKKLEANFPGDFIAEYVGQVRAWFYYLLTVSVGLFDKKSFKNVIVTGTLAGNDGRKMSKSYGNYTDPNELMDKYSADALRFVFLSSPLLNGEDFSLQDKDVADTSRKLSMIWNMFDFFTMYAEVDGWQFDGNLADPSVSLKNPMDQWIVSRLHSLIREVEEHLDKYDFPNAMKPIQPFIEDASNWYVRRSRRRFWKSDNDADKKNAYRTLHYVLVQLSLVLAPFTPFLAEELYRRLTGGESVHLLDWPSSGHINELVESEMKQVREYVNEGLSIRAQKGLKVRQPLASATIPKHGSFVDFENIIIDELNVKSVNKGSKFGLDIKLTPNLKREGLTRETVRLVQNARKKAGLNVDDRIVLSLETSDKQLRLALKEHDSAISAETLAVSLNSEVVKGFETTVKVEGHQLTIKLQKA